MKKKLFLELTTLLLSFSCLIGCGGDKPVPPDPPVEDVEVVSVVFDKSSLTLEEGDAARITATVSPSNATIKTLTWNSSNASVAAVNNGLVSAVVEGSATITATSNNGKSASCNVTVNKKHVDPEVVHVTGVALDKTSVSLKIGESETATLIATVTPNNADNKNVVWNSSDDSVVSVNNGTITAHKEGSANITVTTVDGGFTANCSVTVTRKEEPVVEKIIAYIQDTCNVLKGNPTQKVIGGKAYQTVNPTLDELNNPCYEFEKGASVRLQLVSSSEYIIPLGVALDGHRSVDYEVDSSGYVVFTASVDGFMNDDLFIEIICKDDTPIIGDYQISKANSEHLSIVCYSDEKLEKAIDSVDSNQIFYIKIVSSSEDYGVKTLKVSGKHDFTGYNATPNYNENIGAYVVTAPYSPEDKMIFIKVEEINVSTFKGHPLVGSYYVIRTFGLSGSNSYISVFTNQTLNFAESGKIELIGSASQPAYASQAENGVINALVNNSRVEFPYADKIIVGGMPGTGSDMITPLSNSSNDLFFAIKINDVEKDSKEDYLIDSTCFKINNKVYACVNVIYDNQTYATCYIDVSEKSIVMDVTYEMIKGESLLEEMCVFKVKKDNEMLLHVGYIDDGTNSNRRIITDFDNTYTNPEHSLIFINNEEALFDTKLLRVYSEGENYLLKSPRKHTLISLNSDMTFTVLNDIDIPITPLDVANKVFTGHHVSNQDSETTPTKITFGPSNDNFTGEIKQEKSYQAFYWTFEGVFDYDTNMMTITITDRGMYNSATSKSTLNFDNSIGRSCGILFEDGKITFKGNFSTSPSCYIFMNQVFTCPDFVL